MNLLIKNATIFTPLGTLKNGWLYSEGKTIKGIGAGEVPTFDHAEIIDARGKNLLPGFIDVHVHGAMGYEVMDADPDGLRLMAQYYAQHGVTSFLPTTWTNSYEQTMAALAMVSNLKGTLSDGSTILGVHLEGPYLNPSKCGAQNIRHIRRALPDEATQFLDFNVIDLLALAPEYEENHWLIRECVRRGVTVSAAHTAATFEQIRYAQALGLSHATHTYNAMTPLNHREPGALGAVMTAPEIMCELIADNVHVHPAAMQILYKVKGADHIALITDAIRGAGMPDGEYQIDERVVTIRGAVVSLPDGTLAGSTLTMDRALANFMAATGQPLEKIWQTSSLNAARAIHVSDRKGSLEVGKDADMVMVDDGINVFLTIAEGAIIYNKPG